jgi:acyl dehydratase
MDDVIAHGMLSMAYLGRMLTNRVPQTALREFRVRFTAVTHVHASVRCRGRIAERFERDGERLIRLDLQAANQNAERRSPLRRCSGTGRKRPKSPRTTT